VRAAPGKENLSVDAWVDALDASIAAIQGPVVLVAHSAGVLMVAHWALRHQRPIRGALLAAPPDFERPLPEGYPTMATLARNGWIPTPYSPLRFESIVAGSTNDPLGSLDRVAQLAACWGSTLVNAGAVGHLNPASGYGEWPLRDRAPGPARRRGGAAAEPRRPRERSGRLAVISAPPAGDAIGARLVSRPFAWVVFGLIFGLLLSDYMSRQVLNSVFPLLKAEWGLSDTQLGTLSGIVSVMVGLLTLPLSLAADRWGPHSQPQGDGAPLEPRHARVRLRRGFGSMFAARFLVGVGEAAYGSVGIAVILSVFPPHLRSTLSGAFLAGGIFGSVLGMAIGGAVAAVLGWRWSFYAMAAFGLATLAIFAAVVTERRIEPERHASTATGTRSSASADCCRDSSRRARSSSPTSATASSSSSSARSSRGCRASSTAPTEWRRQRPAGVAAIFVLLAGIGMVAWGMVTDRIARDHPVRKFRVAVAISLATFAFLSIAFRLDAGPAQLFLIGVGIFLAGGRPALPPRWSRTSRTPRSTRPPSRRSRSPTTCSAWRPGPIVTGVLADRIGLESAFAWVPCACLLAAAAFHLGRRHYARTSSACAPPEARGRQSNRRRSARLRRSSSFEIFPVAVCGRFSTKSTRRASTSARSSPRGNGACPRA
jgi:predicted alpha/beta hydrolase family esterase/predicted MFS family arabinose efflux permease